jgi:hypothetical protein
LSEVFLECVKPKWAKIEKEREREREKKIRISHEIRMFYKIRPTK